MSCDPSGREGIRSELADQQEKLKKKMFTILEDRIGMGKKWDLTLQTNQTPCCLLTAILPLQDTKMYYLKNTNQKYLRLRNTTMSVLTHKHEQ